MGPPARAIPGVVAAQARPARRAVPVAGVRAAGALQGAARHPGALPALPVDALRLRPGHAMASRAAPDGDLHRREARRAFGPEAVRPRQQGRGVRRGLHPPARAAAGGASAGERHQAVVPQRALAAQGRADAGHARGLPLPDPAGEGLRLQRPLRAGAHGRGERRDAGGAGDAPVWPATGGRHGRPADRPPRPGRGRGRRRRRPAGEQPSLARRHGEHLGEEPDPDAVLLHSRGPRSAAVPGAAAAGRGARAAGAPGPAAAERPGAVRPR